MSFLTQIKEKPGFFICTTIFKSGLQRMAESTQLGQKAGLRRNSLPLYKTLPVAYCSYYCEGYQASYYKMGIIFETIDPILYASPVDTFVFMRHCKYIPGYENFIFSSKYDKKIPKYGVEKYQGLIDKINNEKPEESKKPLWEMLAKYSTSVSFRKDFREFFHNLSSKEQENLGIGPGVSDEVDWKEWLHESINEIGFRAPLNIRVVDTFETREELKKKFEKLL